MNFNDTLMRRCIAGFLIPAPVLLCVIAILYPPTDALNEIFLVVLGYIIGEAKNASGFYFTSSLSSDNKQETIVRLAEQNNSMAPRVSPKEP